MSSENQNTSHKFPISKLAAITRLTSFTVPFTARNRPDIIFPPPSWELDEHDNPNHAVDNGAKQTSTSAEPTNNTNHSAVDHQEPISFAKRIRDMIDRLPLPGTSTPSNVSEITTKVEKDGPPIPPEVDERMMRMLSSEGVMNGQADDNTTWKKAQSVWDALASIGRRGEFSKTAETQNLAPTKVEQEEDGVMMYTPLEPTNDSQVELAQSKIVLEYVDDAILDESHKTIPKDVGEHQRDSPEKPVGERKQLEKHIWVPSTTEISLLTTWWGYRLYLPPPVMAKLDSTSLKATARAAMITSALKWLLDKVPLTLVPPQFKPAMLLLKRLSPVIGYVGVFISWSWGRIIACDKGNGVVLTATWLLPVALVPMAWDAGDVYGPPLDPNPKPEVAKEGSPKSDNKQEQEKRSFGRRLW